MKRPQNILSSIKYLETIHLLHSPVHSKAVRKCLYVDHGQRRFLLRRGG